MTSTIGDRAEDTAVSADAVLALATSDGTVLSWEEVFDEYAPALTFYARSRGVREPEDLVQDVFVAAFKQSPGFVGDRSGLRSLLFTIAYRRIADHHRRCYRRPETLVAEHSPRPDPGPSVEQIVGLGEAAGQAMRAFAVLSERERRVLQMRIVEEVSPANVGKALGLSSGNVRVIQARALVKIRKHLRSLGDGGFALPMFTFGAVSDSFRYIRAELPADGPLGRWIEELRSDTPPLEAATSVSRAAMTPGSSFTGRVTDHAHSLVSAAISSGGARLGAAVSVAALSTMPLLPAVFLGAGSSQMETTAPVTDVRDAAPTPASQVEVATSGNTVDAPADRALTDAPYPVRSVGGNALLFPAPRPDHDAAPEGAGPAVAGAPQAPASPAVVEGVVEPLVTETVEALVDDVVEPLVGVAVDTVEDTVAVVDHTIGAVADTVGEAVQPIVDDTAQLLLDDLPGTLDDVVPGLGGLLGGG